MNETIERIAALERRQRNSPEGRAAAERARLDGLPPARAHLLRGIMEDQNCSLATAEQRLQANPDLQYTTVEVGDLPPHLFPESAARHLGLPVELVRDAIEAGTLPTVRVGGEDKVPTRAVMRYGLELAANPLHIGAEMCKRAGLARPEAAEHEGLRILKREGMLPRGR